MDWFIWTLAIIVGVSVVTVLANLFITRSRYDNLDTRPPKFRSSRSIRR